MTRTRSAPSPLAAAAREVGARLCWLAPQLVDEFQAALPRAAAEVAHRLRAAAQREQLVAGAEAPRRARPDIGPDQPEEPGQLLAEILADVNVGDMDNAGAAAEATNATINLALAYARRAGLDASVRERAAAADAATELDLVAGMDADDQIVLLERLATEGHNLHPFARTRIGWSAADLLAHDLESPVTGVRFVGVPRELHIGDDLGAILRSELPELTFNIDVHRYAVTVAHEWQLRRLRQRYGGLIRSGALVPLEDPVLPATPTAALRTLLLPRGPTATRTYVKLSLDILVTSTRRTISVASTRNGPVVSAYLRWFAETDPRGARVAILAETAGSAAALPGGSDRDLSAILRQGLTGRLHPAELAVPGMALYARSALTGQPMIVELVDRFAAVRGAGSRQSGAREFLRAYARLVLAPTLTLMTRHGIGCEAHLQNCVPTFVEGVPHRLGLRDFAGIRVYPARLRQDLRLWPGSVIVTGDLDRMRAKVAYTVLQAHLGEIISQLGAARYLMEEDAWTLVREVLDEIYADLRRDPTVAADAAADHAFLTGPILPHKALLRMRLTPAAGDIYVPVRNPLRGPT